MSTTKKKKTAREKRVLIASLIVAGAIVAGSTFAWFTSKDEVTNRLSASANYGVAIAEDFQSPEDWVPGQTINKDVSAVNTGNVDAFVRTWLDGQMKVITEDTTNAIDAAGNNPTNGFKAINDQRLLDLGLSYSNDAGTMYFRTLGTNKIDNPNASTLNVDEDTNIPAGFSEVQSVQAGGVLVYAPANAKYTWTLEQATTMPVYSGGTATDTNLAKGTVVGTGNSTATTKISAADTNYYGAIDASTFTPETTGLYIFRRNVKNAASGDTYEYSGYYFDATKNVYFALHYGAGANGKSDYVLPDGAVTAGTNPAQPVTINNNAITLFQASEKTIETGKTDADLIWAYDGTAGQEKFTVTYKGADAATDDDIVIDIALANIGTASEEWTAITDDTTNPTNATTFYYNNDVEAGDTTTKLVDSVALSDTTTQKAYLAFDFDLNVYLESVQVTFDDNGVEQITSAKEQFATAPTNGTAITAANVVATNTGVEITTINWNKT